MAHITISKSDLITNYESCTREHLINEILTRVNYYFGRTDGTYSVPKVDGQVNQIIEMAIAASLKHPSEPSNEQDKTN